MLYFKYVNNLRYNATPLDKLNVFYRIGYFCWHRCICFKMSPFLAINFLNVIYHFYEHRTFIKRLIRQNKNNFN